MSSYSLDTLVPRLQQRPLLVGVQIYKLWRRQIRGVTSLSVDKNTSKANNSQSSKCLWGISPSESVFTTVDVQYGHAKEFDMFEVLLFFK